MAVYGTASPKRKERGRQTQPGQRLFVAMLYSSVYAQRLKVDVLIGGQRRPCPLDWLDSFCMRNFTGSPDFDDTLPVSDGILEASFRVAPEHLREALSAWLTKRGKGNGRSVEVEIERVR